MRTFEGDDAGFEGYSAAGLGFLSELGGRDKEWFVANRTTYETEVVVPTKALVAGVGDVLRERVSPGVVSLSKTNGSIAPINNDLRFSKGKNPYKDHLLLRFWEGRTKKTAPTLFLRVSEQTIGIASGVVFADLDRWRSAIDDEAGEALVAAIAELAAGHELDVVGAELKTVPKPFAPDHPRADLLRHKGFQVRWIEPTPPEVGSAAFVDWCADRLVECSAVHRWLVQHVS